MDSCFSAGGAILCLIPTGECDGVLATLCIGEDRKCTLGVGWVRWSFMEECIRTCSHLSLMGMWGVGYAYHFCSFFSPSTFVIVDLSQPPRPYFEIWRFQPLTMLKFDSWSSFCLCFDYSVHTVFDYNYIKLSSIS